MHRLLVIITMMFFFIKAIAQQAPDFLQSYNQKWVDSIFNQLTVEEKIGQLLMPRGNVSGKPHDVEKLMMWVRDYKIGGIVFFAGSPTVQAKLTNQLQALSKVPLFIGEDFEWGLNMRMDSTDRYPYQMALGATMGQEENIRRMGIEIGRQCKRLGVHINYAPVVDVNNNIDNPVINFRSFGSDKKSVAEKALSYMKGLQSQRIIATAKHFPGHGDTNVDSHKDIPTIAHDIDRLMDIEIYPFKTLIDEGLSGVMTAHLDVPALESTKGLAATFSSNIINQLLKKQLGFKGITFTDAMDMKGAVKNFPNGTALVKAILAGNDILETFEDVPTAIAAIKKAIDDKTIPIELINQKVIKILKAKSWVGLDRYTPIEIDHLIQDLNTKESDFLNRQFAETSITILSNKDSVVPISKLDQRIAVVSIDASEPTIFQKTCQLYTDVDLLQLPVNASDSLVNALYQQLQSYDQVIIGLHLKEVRASSKYSLNASNNFSIQKFADLPGAVLVIFGNVYALPKLPKINQYAACLIAYQDTKYTEDAAGQIIFGGISAQGRLPISLDQQWTQGHGLFTKADRLSYGIGEQVNINSNKLAYMIDSIVHKGLAEKAYPGAVVQVIKNGKSIYHKAYGFKTYEEAAQAGFSSHNDRIDYTNTMSDAMDYFGPSIMPKKSVDNTKIKGQVETSDMYDLASITKISASALAGMQLMDQGKLDIHKNFASYIPSWMNTNKQNLILKHLLTHKAGLQAWIPFWKNAIDTTETCRKAIAQNPELKKEFLVIVHKPGFFKRLFGKKTKEEIQFIKSINENEKLWSSCLSPSTITWKENTFSSTPDKGFTTQLSHNTFMHKDFINQVYNMIATSPVKPDQGYIYSDLHYYYYPQLVKSMTNENFTTFLDHTYKSIGATTLTFNPLDKFPLSRIVPTEYDSLFRKGLLHGQVHDEGATILSGISGHAGLFGNTNDLSKLLYMYLNQGTYGGKTYINASTINVCTKYQYPEEKNRRALFFDKLDFDHPTNGPSLASKNSYGHSGFTGTFAWIDPDHQLIYVFLSNRVYPSRENRKISTLNIRTEVGNAIYKSIIK